MRQVMARVMWAVVFGATGQLHAQEIDPIELDTIHVEVASRALQTLGAAARSIEILDRTSLERLPASTVAEALRYGAGVDLMPRSPALADVGIRGSSFEQVLILVDGVRVRDSQTGHFNLNLDLPLTAVERIEVLRGSASALYGSDAMAGVINIITRRGDAQQSSASFSGGNFQRLRATAGVGGSIADLGFSLAGDWDQSEGHRPGTDFEAGTVRSSLVAPVGARQVAASVGHARRDFGADGFYGAYPSFESTRTTTAVVSTDLGGERLSLLPNLRLRRHSDDFILYRDDPDRYRNRHSTLQLGGDLIGQFRVDREFTLSAGLHGYRDRLRSEALGNREEDFLAASLEGAWAGDAASASAGVRVDRLPGGGSTWNPSISAGGWPAGWLRIHAAGGSAFRAPTWTERYYRDPVNVGSPDLDPERAWSAEGGAEIFPVGGLRLGATLWLRDTTDLIDWARPADEPNAVWMTRNVDQARFTGMELSANWDILPRTSVSLATALIHLDESSAPGWDSKYALRPETEVTTLSLNQLSGPLAIRVDGSRRRRLGEESYFLLDGRLSWKVRDFTLRADLLNALDADYLDISRLRAAGRSVMIGLQVGG